MNDLTIAFAMTDGALRDALLPATARRRLDAVGAVRAEVLSEFDSAESRQALSEVEVLITGWGCPVIDEHVLDLAPGLALIAHAGGSVKEHVAPACWARGIAVTTAAEANSAPVADYTMSMILLAGKAVFRAAEAYRSGEGFEGARRLSSGAGNNGVVVGVIGASRVGRLVLGRLRQQRNRVLLADPTISATEAAALGAELVGLTELMASSDIVTLHAPLLPSTMEMIGAAELAAMKDGATFINTSRGALVDHDALRDELRRGRIYAVLDVTDPEPLPLDDTLFAERNVLVTPHVAGSMGNELALLGESAVDEVVRFASGRPLAHPVTLDALARMA